MKALFVLIVIYHLNGVEKTRVVAENLDAFQCAGQIAEHNINIRAIEAKSGKKMDVSYRCIEK